MSRAPDLPSRWKPSHERSGPEQLAAWEADLERREDDLRRREDRGPGEDGINPNW